MTSAEISAQREARHAMENLPVEDRDWFIQPMSWEESTRTVLAGSPFKNSVVGVFPTAQIAECIVRDHIAAREAQALAEGVAQPVAVVEFARGKTGNENEMPRVISCNWQPDGQYPVFLAIPVPATSTDALAEHLASDNGLDCPLCAGSGHIEDALSSFAGKLVAENARLREALEPFAASPFADPADESFGLPGEHPVVSHPTAPEITVEDFRRARTALSRIGLPA